MLVIGVHLHSKLPKPFTEKCCNILPVVQFVLFSAEISAMSSKGLSKDIYVHIVPCRFVCVCMSMSVCL
jgi:hypothetical protein